MRTYCQGCGRPRESGEYGCPECKGAIYGPTVGTWSRSTLETEPLHGPLSALTVARTGKVLLKGWKGGGKSSVAIMALRRPFIISTEMRGDLVVSYARRLGAEATVVELAERETVEGVFWQWPEIPPGHDGVVLDSMNVTADPLPLVKLIAQESDALGIPLLIVAQLTQKGHVRGGESVPHWVDVVADVGVEGGQRRVLVEKNRFGPTAVIPFNLAAERPQALYYVVAGPPYRLEAYPWSSSQVWEAVEAGRLDGAPKPPVAAAARQSDLYGGWVEPPDVDDRERYARALGVPYWRPDGRHAQELG